MLYLSWSCPHTLSIGRLFKPSQSLLNRYYRTTWCTFTGTIFNSVWFCLHYGFAVQMEVTRCRHILEYLMWLSYDDWSLWKDCALLVAVVLAGLHDIRKEHIEERPLEQERLQKRMLLLRTKQRSRWNSFLGASRRCRLTAILPAIEIAMYTNIWIMVMCHTTPSSWLRTFTAFISLVSQPLAMSSCYGNSCYRTYDKGLVQLHSFPTHLQSTSSRELAQCAFNSMQIW